MILKSGKYYAEWSKKVTLVPCCAKQYWQC
jgi:hypothetical protein